MKKKVYLLIGAKGSGKTFIGTLFKTHFNIDFIRVEDWMLDLKQGREIRDEEYIRDAFFTIDKGIRKALETMDSIVFESTGLTVYFDKFQSGLRADFDVTTIKIIADLNVCLKRVQTRDQSIHINVSDTDVKKVNALVSLKNLKTDFEIYNENKSTEKLITEIAEIIM